MKKKSIAKKIYDRLRTYYYRFFCHDNYIFCRSGPTPKEVRQDCIFASYSSFSELPPKVKQDIAADGPPDRLAIDKQELDEHAILWVASVDGQVATTVFTRRGRFFCNWFLPLQPDDVVFFRLRTHPEFRGRGLAPALMRYAMHELLDQNTRAYIDCRTYNTPSKRCIEKAGFKCIAIKKTISRDWALYGRDK